MTDAPTLPSLWWMAPARLIGRFRPGLLASAQADAIVLSRIPRLIRTALIPLVIVAIAAAFAALHAFSSGHESPFPLNWLRLHMDYIYTEVPLFIIAASVIGVLAPAAGVLFVLSFGALDLVAAAMQPEELHTSTSYPFPIVGRLVAYWLLWLLAVEVPVVGRVLSASVRRLADRRLAVAALCGAVTATLTLAWAQVTAVLLRPVFVWSHIGGPYADAFVPVQNGVDIFALIAGGTATVVALLRGQGRLLYIGAVQPRSMERATGPAALAISVLRRLIVAGLLTIGLGGLIIIPLDAAVLFIAIAGAGPLARWIARRSPVGLVTGRLTPILRLCLAGILVFVIALQMVYLPALRAVSEYFSLIAVFAIGLFIVELVTASTSASSGGRSSVARAAGVGTLLSVALLAIAFAAPMPVFADNGGPMADIWNTIWKVAVFCAFLPTIFMLALSNAFLPDPPPPPPLTMHSRDRNTYEQRRRREFHAKDSVKEE